MDGYYGDLECEEKDLDILNLLLKEIHCKERQLDCLDYLRYELQKQTIN